VVINKKALIVHGGLSEYEDVTLSEIGKINRKRELPRHKVGKRVLEIKLLKSHLTFLFFVHIGNQNERR